ncbi:penicillin acylase family protein [Actinophytocola sp.]|uniref:penicillin acylase family protein n=1 Tax=Actinophytocola sp. TaxID=1872138 RepID=UPI002ED2B465
MPRRTRTMLAAALALASVTAGVAVAQADPEPAATIRYTEYGIPHVVASDYAGVGFGQGHAAARDHLCTIVEGAVSMDGRRSEFFGPDGRPAGTPTTAATNLSSDLYFRSVNQSRVIERLVAKPAPLGPQREVRSIVSGYVKGFNSFLGTGARTSCQDAPWLRRLTELDVYRRAYAWGTVLGQSGVADALPSGPGASAAVPAAADMSGPGSNSIALGGDATVSGRGISVANPHLPWRGDFLWHQSQLTVPGKLNVSGASFVGLPLMALGHTEGMAWSGTITDGVTPFTVFELRLQAGTPTTYLVDGKPEPMRRRDITVDVRQPDGSMSTVTRTQWWTRYGPVVSGVRGVALPWTSEKAYALADPNTQNMRLLNTLFEFNRARSVPEFVAAAKHTQGAAVFNMLATDSAGRTAYSGASVVPNVTDELANRCNTDLGKQTFPATGLAVLDGSLTSCAWGNDRDAVQPGTFGPGNLPILERRDYVANANESYWLTNADAPMKRYPRILGTWEQQRNVRTRGALTEITDQLANAPFDVRATQDLVLSNRSMAADLARADTVTMCRDLGQDVADACTALSNWDGRFTVDSRGALLFSRYWSRIGRLPSAQLWQVPFDLADPVRTPNTLNTANPVVRQALLDAVGDLRGAGIPLDAPLREYQYTERGGERFPIGGGRPELGVFNVVASDWDRGYPAIGAGLGSNSTSYLHVVAFDGDRCPEARTVMAYSQSSDPLSAHHADQTALFSRSRWVTERFCERDIQSAPNLEVLHVGRR